MRRWAPRYTWLAKFSFLSCNYSIQDLAKQWAKVDDKGREKYQKEAAKLKTKYEKDVAAYEAAK